MDVVEVVEDEETVEVDVETDVVVDVDKVVDDELDAVVVVVVELEDIWIGRVTSPVLAVSKI